MKLLIAEKKSASELIANALSEEPDIVFAEIGGHIFTSDEKCIAEHLSDDEFANLRKGPKFTLPDGEIGYVLGKETIDENINNIKELLVSNDIDVIINACEPDKNGKALFDYANSVIKFDASKIVQLSLFDMSEDHIRKQYQSLKRW